MDVDITGTGFDAGRLQRIAEHLDRQYVAKGKIAGAEVAIGRRGKVAYHASVGLRDRERNVPLGDDTIFRIYSMTKPLTSIALMQLFERGLFQLDEPVARWYPAWRNHQVYVSGDVENMVTEPARRPVSVRDLRASATAVLSCVCWLVFVCLCVCVCDLLFIVSVSS